MKRNTSPLFWDLEAQGNVAPTVTPGASPTPITFNISALDTRIDDMWPTVQAIVVRVDATITQGGSAAVLNEDKLWSLVESFRVYSPVLGDLVTQRSGQGAAIGLIDQVLGAGYKFPRPARAQISSSAADYTVSMYYRIPLALDWLSRPQDGGIWAGLLEKGSLSVSINATTASLFQSNASIKAATTTVRAWLEVLPIRQPIIHSPWKAVRYEFTSAGSQMKLLNFGSGDGLLGVNPGARLSFLAWLSSNNGLGGVDTIEKFNRINMQFRRQRSTNNPDAFMYAFQTYLGRRVGAVGSIGSGTINDRGAWPYQMGAGPDGSSLDSTGLFLPLIFPGHDAVLSGQQKLVGDLSIDASFSANPNGTHVFRAHEHYSWKPETIARLLELYGFDPKTFTAEPKLADNSSPDEIEPSQQWGLPLRIVPRSGARFPVI